MRERKISNMAKKEFRACWETCRMVVSGEHLGIMR